MACPVTVIAKLVVLRDPETKFPDCRSLESHTNVTTLREYVCGWLSVSVSEADSVPALSSTGGIMAQTESFASGVLARDWHGSGVDVADPATGFDVPA